MPPGSRLPTHVADRFFVFYASIEDLSDWSIACWMMCCGRSCRIRRPNTPQSPMELSKKKMDDLSRAKSRDGVGSSVSTRSSDAPKFRRERFELIFDGRVQLLRFV